jgi:flagellar secretion chaperone FliS
MANPYGAYLESRVLSASPLQLVQLAYEGALEAVRAARQHLAERRIVERSRSITKAQELLFELARSLNFETGGELSINLARLYDYLQRCLVEANTKQLDAPLAEVEQLLETLAEGWNELVAKESSATVGSGWSAMAAEAPAYSSRTSYSL